MNYQELKDKLQVSDQQLQALGAKTTGTFTQRDLEELQQHLSSGSKLATTSNAKLIRKRPQVQQQEPIKVSPINQPSVSVHDLSLELPTPSAQAAQRLAASQLLHDGINTALSFTADVQLVQQQLSELQLALALDKWVELSAEEWVDVLQQFGLQSRDEWVTSGSIEDKQERWSWYCEYARSRSDRAIAGYKALMSESAKLLQQYGVKTSD